VSPADARRVERRGPDACGTWPGEQRNGAFASGADVLNATLGLQIDAQVADIAAR
jgi:hypothetical protein